MVGVFLRLGKYMIFKGELIKVLPQQSDIEDLIHKALAELGDPPPSGEWLDTLDLYYDPDEGVVVRWSSWPENSVKPIWQWFEGYYSYKNLIDELVENLLCIECSENILC